MAKKHPNRPALRAVDVWRWISRDILKIKQVSRSAVFYLLDGKNVRQTWLKKTRRRGVFKISAVTYLRKGIFLIPLWIEIPDWEVDYLRKQGLNFRDQGIALIDGRYLRLCYMQIEDLDHAKRQQSHIIDGYLLKVHPLMSDFMELFEKLARAKKIIGKIESRSRVINSLSFSTKMRLRENQMSLKSILANAPLFARAISQKEREPVISALRKMAAECRSLSMRPISRRMGWAARSLELAISHIENNCLGLAKKRFKSALKNLEYPKAERG